MASDLTGGNPPFPTSPGTVRQDAPGAALGPATTHSPRAPGNRLRFGIAYLALAVLLGGAIGLFVVFVGATHHHQIWSTWKPTQQGVQGRAEIARHVSKEYALVGGSQLVSVLSGPPEVQQTPVRAIIARTGLAGETFSDLQIYDASKSWTYILCGDGANCSIPQGKPSTARGRLLSREALELALYTFKYSHGVDSVVVFMPPPPGQQAKTSLFFRKKELSDPLKHPLGTTLEQRPERLVVGGLSGADLEALRKFVDPRIYNYEFQQAPDGSALMVLSPVTT